MKKYLYCVASFLFTILFLDSCNPKQQPDKAAKNEIDTLALIQQGDSMSTIMQQVLLSNVIQATKTGGPAYAVAFCNERAMPLTDSLSERYNCRIQRISAKYRNQANKPDKNDEAVLMQMSAAEEVKPILKSQNGERIYYKPIKIALPACLNCHGNEEVDIAPTTMDAIRSKYPNDLATGYKEGDFRGMWKITFPEK